MPSTVCQQHDAVNQKSTRIHTFTLALPCTAAYQSSDCGSVSGDWEELAKTCAVTGHVRKQAVPKHFRTPLLAADEHFSERLSSSGLARNKNPTKEASQSVHQFDTFTRSFDRELAHAQRDRQTGRYTGWIRRDTSKNIVMHTRTDIQDIHKCKVTCVYMYACMYAGRQAGRQEGEVCRQSGTCVHACTYVCM